jgi:hypothetical protein
MRDPQVWPLASAFQTSSVQDEQPQYVLVDMATGAITGSQLVVGREQLQALGEEPRLERGLDLQSRAQ